MKIKIKVENEKPQLEIHYEGEEYEKLKQKFQEIGVEEATTNNAWNEQKVLEYYRARNRVFFDSCNFNSDRYHNEYVDDINASVFDSNIFNIAVFRAKPKNNITKVPLNELLSVIEVNTLSQRIAQAIEKIYNLVTGEIEIKVNTGM